MKFKELTKESLENLILEIKNLPENAEYSVIITDMPDKFQTSNGKVLIERYIDICPDAEGGHEAPCTWYNKKIFDYFDVSY